MRDQRAHARARSRRVAHSVASSFAAWAGHNHFRRRRLRRPVPALRARRLRGGDLLSVPELAALARLPVGDHVPGLRRAGAAAVAPPPQVPTGGPGVRPLGVSDAVAGRPVGLAVPDARHHVWIVGATGVGKSTLLVHGVLADAASHRAAVVLDPKGDLITDILARLPDAARARTVVIDPDQPQHGPDGLSWPCLNPLAPATGAMTGREAAVGDAAAENVVTIFSRVFSSAWGFRSEDLLRVACLTVRAGTETPSLDMLPALLTNPDARAHAIRELPRHTGTAALREFWNWYEHLSEPARAQISAPLLNKLRAILLRPFAARVLCGPSTVDLPRLLDTGGLLLVRMPKGPLGEDTVRLLGSLIVAQVWQAATARAAQPEHQRRDASLVLDECHNFLNLPYKIEDMLAEARGYRLGLTLSHQYLGQLPPELRDGIATDARSKILFTSAPEDAARLAKHTAPELSAHDLAHLDAFHAAARLLCHGGDTRAFTFHTRPLPPPDQPGRDDQSGEPGRASGPPTIPLPVQEPHRPTPLARPAQNRSDPMTDTTTARRARRHLVPDRRTGRATAAPTARTARTARGRVAGLRLAVTGQVPAAVRATVLAEHHASLARRRRATIAARVRDGVHPARVPYGYRVDHTGTLDRAGALRAAGVGGVAPPYLWERDPGAAAVVRLIYWLCRDGYRDARIVAALSELRDIPRPVDARTGEPRAWSPAIVAGILTDPAYRGHQVWGRTRHGRTVPARDWTRCPRSSHPPLIDQALYAAVQHARRARRTRRPLDPVPATGP